MIRLENVLKISLQDVLKMSWRRLEDVWPRRIYWSWPRPLEDVLKTSPEDVRLRWTYSSWSRRLQDVFTKTNVCWVVTLKITTFCSLLASIYPYAWVTQLPKIQKCCPKLMILGLGHHHTSHGQVWHPQSYICVWNLYMYKGLRVFI